MHTISEAFKLLLRQHTKVQLSAYTRKPHIPRRPRAAGWGARGIGDTACRGFLPRPRPRGEGLSSPAAPRPLAARSATAHAHAALPRPRPEPRLSSHRRGSSAPPVALLRQEKNEPKPDSTRTHARILERHPSQALTYALRRCTPPDCSPALTAQTRAARPGASAPHCAVARRS